MLISLSGRIGSGKTTLANYLVKEQGFIKLSMATRLKELCKEMYGWSDEEISSKDKCDVRFGYGEARVLEHLTGLKIREHYAHYETIREALQDIGTEIIRKAEPNYHINYLITQIKDGYSYVVDDVRFPNELARLRGLGLPNDKDIKCFCIVRPYYQSFSNHVSETSLNFTDFYQSEHLFNTYTEDSLVEELKDKLNEEYYCESATRTYSRAYANMFRVIPTSAFIAGLVLANNSFSPIFNSTFETVDDPYFVSMKSNNKELLYLVAEYLGVRVLGNQIQNLKYNFSCSNEYIMESLKLWDLSINKTSADRDYLKPLTMPSILNGAHKECIDAWLAGTQYKLT